MTIFSHHCHGNSGLGAKELQSFVTSCNFYILYFRFWCRRPLIFQPLFICRPNRNLSLIFLLVYYWRLRIYVQHKFVANVQILYVPPCTWYANARNYKSTEIAKSTFDMHFIKWNLDKYTIKSCSLSKPPIRGILQQIY